MKKILSLILAVSLVASLLVVSVSAAGAHTVTISADKTEALAAGDTVTVTLTIDNSAGVSACEYDLLFDEDVFELDTTKASKRATEAYIDAAWFEEIEDAYEWGDYFNDAQYTPSTDYNSGVTTQTPGKIIFAWAGDSGVDEADALDNVIIGKFYFKVKADAADGETTLSLSDESKVNGVKMAFAPLTLTVGDGSSAPEGPTVGAAADYTGNAVAGGKVAGITIKETDKKYDNCYAVSATIENAVGQIGVLFVPQDVNDWGKAADAVYGDNLGGGTVTINAALRGIPTSLAGRDIVMLSKAYALVDSNYTYGTELTTTINFDVTAE